MRNARLVLGIAVVLSVGCCSLLLQLRTTAVGAPERAANTAEVVARSAAFAAPTQTWEKQRVFASAVEGEDDFAHLECPTGQTIHSIDFASFGTPARGPDGALDEDPTCHAPSSREVAAEACLHQTACQLAPSAEAFGGDPCPDKGEAKRLDLQATCGHAEQGQFAYEGCFAHNSHKLISLWTDEPTSWVDCRDLANYREATFFALEHPLTYPAGLGNCGLAGDYAGEGHIGTTSCKHGVDYNGRPLGGPDALAVYSISVDTPAIRDDDDAAAAAAAAAAPGAAEVVGAVGDAAAGEATFGWAIHPHAQPLCEPGCGTSLLESQYVCVRSDSTIVDDSLCVAEDRPVSTTPCESYDTCTYRYEAAGYEECAAACGASAMWQQVYCVAVELDQHVDEEFCVNAAQAKPPLSLECEDYSLCSYDWVWADDWHDCDASCGAGTETRTVKCQRTDPSGQNAVTTFVPASDLPDGYALNNCRDPPAVTRECWATHGCEYSWVADDWSECDATCGVEGMQSRSIACRQGSLADDAALGLGSSGVPAPYVDEGLCVEESRPAKNRICNDDSSCTYAWRENEWEECPPGCGFMERKRGVTCIRSDGSAMPALACEHATGEDGEVLVKPADTEPCTSRATCSYGWRKPLPWDDPSLPCSETCGQGVKQRTTDCLVQSPDSPFHAEVVAASFCDAVDDPEWLQIECFDYSGCCHEWAIGDWQEAQCAAACGKSVMPRPVHCERRLRCGEPETALETVLESFCSEPKPSSTQECYSVEQCCFEWKVEEWSQCQPSCGTSQEVREVWCERCDDQQVDSSECTNERSGPPPPTAMSCQDYTTCSYAWHMKTADLGTCFDGFRNGDETALDCGGSCPDCKVDGGWSDYGEWSECTAQCGKGTVTSSRSCTNPAPANGGRDCVGEATLTKACALAPCQVDFDAQCTYTVRPHTFQMQLAAGVKQKVTTIEAGKANVLIKVAGTADMDLSLETTANEKLVSYSAPNLNWGQADLTHENAVIHSCTDGCSTDVSVRFNGDGAVHELQGDSSYSSEYVYFETSTDELLLFVTGYGEGEATVSYEFDCPATCDACDPVTQEAAVDPRGGVAVAASEVTTVVADV